MASEKAYYIELTETEAALPFMKFVEAHLDTLRKFGFLQVKYPANCVSKSYSSIQLHKNIRHTFQNGKSVKTFQLSTEDVKVSATNVAELKEFCNESYPTPGEEVTPRKFWETVSSNYVYSVDIDETLFPSFESWNLNCLGDCFTEEQDGRIPGVNTPFIYAGSYGSVFALHVENLNLGSVNYLFEGKKYWNIIPGRYADQVSKKINERVLLHQYECANAARHKIALINPLSLVFKGIINYETVQFPGEYMIIDHNAYHQGFALDFSVCEAVNFGLDNWKEFASSGTYCSCKDDDDDDDDDEPDKVNQILNEISRSITVGEVPLQQPNEASSKPTKRMSVISDPDYEQPPTKTKPSIKTRQTEEAFTFEDDTTESVIVGGKVVNPLARGRKTLPDLPPAMNKGKKLRTHKKCPICGKSEISTNLARHLRKKHGIRAKAKLEALTTKTSHTARSGLRPIAFNDVPEIIKDHWKEKAVRLDFERFLTKYNLYIAKDEEEDEEKEIEDEEMTINSISASSDDENNDTKDPSETVEEETNLSSKAKMMNLPYPKLDSDNYELIKACYDETLKRTMSEKQAKAFVTQSSSVLGYAHMTHPEDKNGFISLSDSNKLCEYIDILTHEVKLSPSTIKCYCETVKKIFQYVQKDLFDNPKLLEDLEKFPTLADDLKKAERAFAPTAQRAAENSNFDTAARQNLNADNMPDPRSWDEFLNENEARFQNSLQALEKASDEIFLELEKHPGASELRMDFNFVVSYFATYHILKSAARPGEFDSCTLQELYKSKVLKGGDRIIHVALHKTGEREQASIHVKQDMVPVLTRYINIMKRFKKPKHLEATVKKRKVQLAFPYASNKGFIHHHCVYRELNKWCDLKNMPHFTANLLRKVAETYVEYEDDDATSKKVAKGLNHSRGAAGRYYKKSQSKVILERKQAVENTLNLSKGFNLIKNGEFEVNIYEGRLEKTDFNKFLQTKVGYDGDNDELFHLYCQKWLELAEPLLIEELITHVKSEETIPIDDIDATLDALLVLDDFKDREADIKRKIKELLY